MKRIESLLRAHEIAALGREKMFGFRESRERVAPKGSGGHHSFPGENEIIVLKKIPLFAKKSEDRGALYIYEMIGTDWWTGGGVTGKSVAEALDQMKGVKTLDIFINSEGGDVFEADAIYANLKRFGAEKVVHIDGIAASAASFIAMVGDEIIFSPVAMMMIHEASTGAIGRAEDFRATADLLDKANQVLAETYSKKTGKSVADVLELLNAETWMTADEALKSGFATSISDAAPVDMAAAKASAPFIALEAATVERSRLARQAHRLNDLKTRPVQTGKERPASR